MKKIELTRDTCTDSQRRCWDALAWLFNGAHHFGGPVRPCGNGIATTTLGDAATFDGDFMTRAVCVAHIDAVRIAICNGGPHRLRIEAHPREHHSDSNMHRHPTPADLIADLQSMVESAKRWREKQGSAK